ncbi:rod shape-determining protein MreC [Sphingosinicella sp. YJ22]|uniref:rod shape-determining protein MreC n=1 Tax=Sphingosinicella sp. YJ22 TaxID=1104780 RepID=UPI00140D780B|nr:rod shape-determining protein MreC [Sphingosinicella sp. YJ22]
MAPPRNRRPGSSRRAQYGLFFGYVVAVGGVLFALLLLLVSIVDPRGFAAIKGAAMDVTTPVSSAGRSVLRGITDFGTGIGDYFRAGSQNAELRARLQTAEAQAVQAEAQRLDNQRLRQMLQLRETATDEIAVGRIVSSSFDSPRRFAILAVGGSSGVRIGQPVRAPEGLIGRVLLAGRHSAQVLLIVDPSSTVPVRLVRDGTPAMAVGRGDGTLELRTLEVGVNPFRRGDMLVTSGVGGIYPPGIPVAQVIGIQGEVTIARPLATPARVDYALVQPLYEPAVVPRSDGGAAEPAAEAQ